MCGIVGYSGMQSASPILLEGLAKLEYRGYDSAGIAVESEGCIKTERAPGKLANLAQLIKEREDLQGRCGIGHTRWATHGAPTANNAHPHMSNDGKFAVVHNGIIENYIQLREELTEKGYHFNSETDTEVIAHLLEMYYIGDFKQAVMKTVARLQGSYALGVVCTEHPGEVFAVKYESPLILGVGYGENYFASDVTALISHTRTVIYLEDGEFASITPEKITIYNQMGREIEKNPSHINWSVDAAEKGGYDHFMLKEIMEQPKALKSAIEPRIKNGKIQLDEIPWSTEELKNINQIVVTACGSAYHAGVVGSYVFEELTNVPVRVEVASELRYRNNKVDENTLYIVISQSGETADTIAAMKNGKKLGAKILAIVNVVDSTIAKLADAVLYTYAGPEIAVATTKGYTTQVTVLSMFAVYFANIRGTINENRYNDLVNGLLSIPERAQRSIDLNRQVSKFAAKYHGNTSLFFIGRNIDYAVCLEASLKLKEISYIHSEAYAAGELKHGTIALIEENRLVVSMCCYQSLFGKMLGNIKEVKARGANVLAVAIEGDRNILTEADDVIFIPKLDELLMPVAEIIPMQLFAYYVAKENGCDIDKPKNLAKSVTVE